MPFVRYVLVCIFQLYGRIVFMARVHREILSEIPTPWGTTGGLIPETICFIVNKMIYNEPDLRRYCERS